VILGLRRAVVELQAVKVNRTVITKKWKRTSRRYPRSRYRNECG